MKSWDECEKYYVMKISLLKYRRACGNSSLKSPIKRMVDGVKFLEYMEEALSMKQEPHTIHGWEDVRETAIIKKIYKTSMNTYIHR